MVQGHVLWGERPKADLTSMLPSSAPATAALSGTERGGLITANA
jgi:hypothetical protein